MAISGFRDIFSSWIMIHFGEKEQQAAEHKRKNDQKGRRITLFLQYQYFQYQLISIIAATALS